MGFHDAHATYVGSLQLRTLDLERAVQFYRQVVGLKTLEQDAGSATLSADGKTPYSRWFSLRGDPEAARNHGPLPLRPPAARTQTWHCSSGTLWIKSCGLAPPITW